jgi:hypothetical protein
MPEKVRRITAQIKLQNLKTSGDQNPLQKTGINNYCGDYAQSYAVTRKIVQSNGNL